MRILTCEPDADYNRSVMTLVGDPETVLKGAFATIKACAELIDMRNHKGGHPRMGACDVTPFIPVANVTMDECAEIAKELGQKVGQELDIPVYLYGEAALRPDRPDPKP